MYIVIDGDNDNNPDQAKGYAGMSNYEENGTPRDEDCAGNGPDQGTAGTTNSGGCFGIDGGPWIDMTTTGAPTPMCGNTSGNRWDDTARDGCSNP